MASYSRVWFCSPAIARALVRNPTVLLLDECVCFLLHLSFRRRFYAHSSFILFRALSLRRATSALDSGAEHQVNQAITQILEQRSITVILVAHRLSSIARARKIIVVEDGKITEEGLYSELVRFSLSRSSPLPTHPFASADAQLASCFLFDSLSQKARASGNSWPLSSRSKGTTTPAHRAGNSSRSFRHRHPRRLLLKRRVTSPTRLVRAWSSSERRSSLGRRLLRYDLAVTSRKYNVIEVCWNMHISWVSSPLSCG
jgi:hypothetical protein